MPSTAAVIVALCAGCASAAPPEAKEPIPVGEAAAVLDGERYLEYRVGVNIEGTPDEVWAVLTNAPAYPEWNSTVISLDGTIAKGETIELKAKIDPSRTFELEVSTFEPAQKLVWEDGGKAFKGVRTFTLTAKDNGTTDVTMAEVLTGMFMNSIEKKLPDFRPSFDAFAADLKREVEGGAAAPATEDAPDPSESAAQGETSPAPEESAPVEASEPGEPEAPAEDSPPPAG